LYCFLFHHLFCNSVLSFPFLTLLLLLLFSCIFRASFLLYSLFLQFHCYTHYMVIFTSFTILTYCPVTRMPQSPQSSHFSLLMHYNWMLPLSLNKNELRKLSTNYLSPECILCRQSIYWGTVI
jgi:hypothetical protein